jgi:hypothetical protein
MDAARSMARFTTDVERIGTFGLQARVCGCREIAGDIAMAFLTTFRANECGVWDLRGHDYNSVNRRAGNEYDRGGQGDEQDQNLDKDTSSPNFAK